MARSPLARRIAHLTPIVAAAAALAAPAAASAQAAYPTGDGLIGVSAAGTTTTVWPDGTNVIPNFAAGVVGTFDGAGNNLSLKTGNKIATLFSMTQNRVLANVAYDSDPVGATALNPTGALLAIVAGGSLRTYTGPGTWTPVAPAVGRFGWATKPGKQRRVYVAGPGAVNGGGQDISGSIVVREQDDSEWLATMEPGSSNPTVSPDGRWIAFERTTDGQRDVYLIDTTVDEPPFLAADQSNTDEYLPTFSPDSARLVFARADGSGTELREIPTSRVAASRLVTTLEIAPVSGLAWQPSVKPTAGTVALGGSAAPKTGEALSYTASANSGSKPQVETFQWQRCPAVAMDADGCTDLSGEKGASYTPVGDDVGHRLRVRREVAGPAGTNVKYSNMSEIVVAGAEPPAKPTFTVAPTVTNEPYPKFEWTGAQPGGTFECRYTNAQGDQLVDSGWGPCTSPGGTLELTPGQWTYMVRQVDEGGQKGAVAYHLFTVDFDPPAKPELIMQTVKGLDASVSFTSGSNEIVTFECRLDGIPEESASPWTPCPGAWSGKDLAEGKHHLDIRAIDKAGNRSEIVTAEWTNKKPVVVEQPKPETPVQETPATTPAVEAPKPAPVATTPAAPAPAPAAKPAAAKAPALAVTIGGTKSGAQTTGGTSSAATIEVAKESVGVGCSITGTVLKSCKVDLYAPKASGAKARAAAAEEVLVGTGTYVNAKGSSKMDVKIELNATGKAMLRRNPDGLKVSVKITGNPVNGPALKATGVAKLVTDRASLTVGGFAVDSAVLTGKAKAQLRVLAKFGKVASVRCVGHTDGSSDDAKYLRTLGADRAKAVCAYLAKHGVKASAKTLVSKADTVPAATNATKAGRAQNRRVQVTLVR